MVMDKIDIGDVELATWREGTGDPVFLVSALGGRAAFWSELVPVLSSRFDVITHDHRGTGSSTKSKIAYSVPQMATDVLKLMDKMGIAQTAVVGHSTGGAIAQYLAINHADRLSKIVLSATWAGPSIYFQTLFDLRSKILRDVGPEAYLVDGIMRAYPPDTLTENPDILSGTREERLASFPGAEIELSRVNAVLAHDLRDQISQITSPALVICAADDQITPVGFSHELIDKIPNARSVILPHGGHFVPRVATKDYNAAVLSFLTDSNSEA